LQGHPLPADQVHAVQLWREVMSSIATTRWGWRTASTGIAKLQIIERERERSGVELSDPKIALIDLLYHDTSFERGLYYRRQGPWTLTSNGER